MVIKMYSLCDYRKRNHVGVEHRPRLKVGRLRRGSLGRMKPELNLSTIMGGEKQVIGCLSEEIMVISTVIC